MHINKHSCSKFMLESRQLIYRYHMITCSQNLFLQEVRKSKILLGKAGILKDDEEEQEVNYMYIVYNAKPIACTSMYTYIEIMNTD